MSVEFPPVQTEANRSVRISAGKYMSYLWLGHCIHYPEDYRSDLVQFHESPVYADADMTQFQQRLEKGPEMILINELRGIVKSARIEAGIKTPLTEIERSRLKIYLVGEVAVRGRELAKNTGLFEDYPDLESVQNPLADYQLVDGVMRYQNSGKISAQFSRYANMERLLPGYLPISEG